MKKMFWLAAALFLAGCLPAMAQESQVSPEDIFFREIPQVITASKRAESADNTPSVTYVVTSDQIKRWAARSLVDVLKRVPGMRISVRESSLIGSRGFTSDQNDKFVFLIDGMQIRNVIQDGSYNMADMPDLDMVERIEIVKGPGSTLWGSDAAFGIINIITKKGGDIGGVRVSLDGSTNDRLTVANILAGDRYENGEYLFSLTCLNSHGFSDLGEDRGGAAYDWNYPNGTDHWGGNMPGNKGALFGEGSRLLDFSPGFELYSKIRLGETTLKSRGYYLAQSSIWEAIYGRAEEDNVMKHFTSQIENVKDLGRYGELTTKIGAHLMAYERSVPRGASDVSVKSKMDIMTETGLDAETYLNTAIGDDHKLIIGAKGVSTYMGPSELSYYYVASGEATGDITGDYKYFISLPPALDNSYGLYLEDNYKLSDRITLVGGLGAEYNDQREKTTQFMPRLAAVLKLSEAVTAKYAYNTGYERPPAQKKLGAKPYGFVRNSESISEHDLQFIVKRDRTRATATIFNYRVQNYFTFGPDPSGSWGHINLGAALGSGLETDFLHYFSDNLALYANYTFADSMINGSRVVGEPRHFYNIGADFYRTKDLSVNLNVNGWADMYHGTYNGESLSWSGDGEQSADLSLVADNLGGRPICLTVYGKNILNNKIHVGMTGWPGYTYEKGASYGLKVACKF